MTPEQILQKCVYDHGFNDALDDALKIIDKHLPWDRTWSNIRKEIKALRGEQK